MNEQITDFVRSCLQCQKNKAARHQPYGLLTPMELPHTPWQWIAMDFITDLPLSDECDQLWVVVDRFTKMTHFIPLPKEGKSASDLARTFARKVWCHHGLPSDIVSDWDSRFTFAVWQEFLTLSGSIRPRMSTAFHPQTDGQTERLNQTIEAYLRSFISYEQDDWVSLQPMAEFAYNNSTTNAMASRRSTQTTAYIPQRQIQLQCYCNTRVFHQRHNRPGGHQHSITLERATLV